MLLPRLSSHCESPGILDVPSSPWHYVCPEVLPKVLLLAWEVILSMEPPPQPQLISLARILEVCCRGYIWIKDGLLRCEDKTVVSTGIHTD